MSRPTWAVELSATDTETAQALRLVHGVEARFSDDHSKLWLRGAEVDLIVMRTIRQLPCLQRYSLMEDGRGIPEGKVVPTINLSGAGWVPLRHLITLAPPIANPAGSTSSNVGLRLVPSSIEARAEVLCVPFQDWHDYVVMAPAIRLEALVFAVSDDGRALIHGTPLPPLRGEFFQINHGIATPAGFALDPPIAHALVASHFRLRKGDILLFRQNGICEFIAAGGLAQASRSAVRETANAHASLKP